MRCSRRLRLPAVQLAGVRALPQRLHAAAPIHTRGVSTAAAEPEVSLFAGAQSEYTTRSTFWYPHKDHLPPSLPCFRITDDLGDIVPGAEASLPDIDRETAVRIQTTMIRVSEFDKVYNDAQRQGRISFYMTSRGEEACSVVSAAALRDADWLLPQYRELGAAFWRGFTFEEVANQLCSNCHDPAHGRQLPLHIGSRAKHFVYVKSTLGTHSPHAAGVAFAMRQQGKDQVALAYFGEGSASEGDFPSGLNIAAVHNCPTIFFVRNNGYAISTKAADQYVGDGIAPRGIAYGMPTIRIDGNDTLAVYSAVKEARRICSEEKRPVLIEAMTYRSGAHSTSDDDSAYRTADSPADGWDSERAYWEARSPIIRFGRFLMAKGWYSPHDEDLLRKEARAHAIKALNEGEQAPKPSGKMLFTDVYDELPWMLEEQKSDLKRHLDKYGEHYTHLKEQIKGLED